MRICIVVPEKANCLDCILRDNPTKNTITDKCRKFKDRYGYWRIVKRARKGFYNYIRPCPECLALREKIK